MQVDDISKVPQALWDYTRVLSTWEGLVLSASMGESLGWVPWYQPLFLHDDDDDGPHDDTTRIPITHLSNLTPTHPPLLQFISSSRN